MTHRRWLRVAAVASLVSLWGSLGATVAGSPAAAAPAVRLLSSSQWGPDGAGFEHVVGEVVNNGPGIASLVEVDLDFLNSAGTLVGTDFTFAYVNDMNPGEKSPFEDIFTPPPGYNHFRITSITPAQFSASPNHNFTTTVTNRFVDQFGDTHIVGTVRNNNRTTSDFVEPVFTFYNGAGVAVEADFTFVNSGPSSSIGPGQTASFEELLFADPARPAFSSFAILTQSSSPPSGQVPPQSTQGYWFAAADGGIFSFKAPFFGSTGGIRLAQPVVGMAATSDGRGYWLVARDGGIFAFGNAPFFGSTGAIRLAQPIVGMAADPATGGYWFVAADGGVFSFHAPFFGSTGGIRLAQPVVGMAATPDGRGYWLVARDGGIFAFGDARFFGSTGGISLAQPIVGMAADRATGGYWFVAADGGIFSFNAPFLGSTGSVKLAQPVVGMAATADGGGYWLVARDGGIFAFGNAPFFGSTGGISLAQPIVGMTAR